MNEQTLVQTRLEIPTGSLRLIQELVEKMGGRVLPDEQPEAVYIAPPIPEGERVGRMLRGLRLRAGLTQRELAAAIGVPQSHISAYERNKRRIPPHKAQELARVLETVPTHFEYRD